MCVLEASHQKQQVSKSERSEEGEEKEERRKQRDEMNICVSSKLKDTQER